MRLGTYKSALARDHGDVPRKIPFFFMLASQVKIAASNLFSSTSIFGLFISSKFSQRVFE